MMKRIRLRTKIPKRVLKGHLWIFSNELDDVPKFPKGEIVEIFDKEEVSLGIGFFNPNSLIAIRLLKCTKDDNFNDIIKSRIHEAKRLREKIFPKETSYRLVYSESDFLPGLIIDRYEHYFVIQINSAGMENFLETIIQYLVELFPSLKGIFIKNISHFRKLEGLDEYQRVGYGHIPDEIEIYDNDIRLKINIAESQKTGLFLDHRLNRMFLRNLSENMDVLDCYSNYGGFGLYCAFGKANRVTCVDISNLALERAKINFELNNFTNLETEESDVLEFLRNSFGNNRKWDIVILDPPSFTKSKQHIRQAILGYTQINKYAIRVLNNFGFLATASCSMHISEETFLETIKKVALSQNIQLKLIYRGNQSPDHPILIAMPETNYLKFFVFQVVKSNSKNIIL